MLAIGFPIILLAIPAVNLLVNPADFQRRWVDEWVSTVGVTIVILWLVYAFYPSAFRLLRGGPDAICVKGGTLEFSNGERRNLSDVSGVEVLRPWLQHPRVEVRFPKDCVLLETAYQELGERKSAEVIANAIAQAARSH